MLHPLLIDLANEFQTSHAGLDANTTDAAYIHDAIHAVTGLGVDLESEELVLNLTNALSGEETNPKHDARMLSLISIIPTEILNILITHLNQH